MAWIGVDLGGTKVFAVRLSESYEVEAEGKVKTPADGPDAVVAAIAALVAELGLEGVRGIGVGAPGLVDPEGGVVRKAPNLRGWGGSFPLVRALRPQVGELPVVLDNDVNAGTVAEWHSGAGAGAAELLGVFVGTGVGGALVLEGRLHRGRSGNAGEIGHMIVHDGGRPCGCGGAGHLEAYAGRASLERTARELHAAGRPSALVELAGAKRMTSGVFARALSGGDPVATELITGAVEALGAAVASVVNLLDLRRVVIGGGLADRLGAEFVAAVEAASRRRLLADDPGLAIVGSRLGDRAGAIGAALGAAGAADDAVSPLARH